MHSIKNELIGSAVAHALFALLLFAISMRAATLPPPADIGEFMSVTPVDALPAGMLAVPEADVPAPAEDAAVDEPVSIPVEEPKAIPIEPKPVEQPKPKPKEEVKKTTPAKPAEQPKEEPAAAKSSAGPVETKVTSGGQGTQGGSILGLKGGTPGGRAATYPDRVTNKVYYTWRNPAKMQETITCSVIFRIDRDGKASQIALDRSSGLPAFDNSAVRAVYEAAPYPPFSRSMEEEYILMRITFEYIP